VGILLIYILATNLGITLMKHQISGEYFTEKIHYAIMNEIDYHLGTLSNRT